MREPSSIVPEFVPAIDSSAPMVTMNAPMGPISAAAADGDRRLALREVRQRRHRTELHERVDRGDGQDPGEQSASGRSRRGFLNSPAGTPRFSKPAYANSMNSAASLQFVPGPGSVNEPGIGFVFHTDQRER